MLVKEKSKLNKFKMVRIPTKAEYMGRFGAMNTPVPYTGDESAEGLGRKTEQMAQVERDMQEFDKQRQAEEDKKKSKAKAEETT